MVWGSISWNGVGRLHRVNGIMNAVQYCEILSKSLLGGLADEKLHPTSIIFQQDNDPKHTSRMAQRWFQEHDITLLPWPPSSPDMNIIEHVWDHLDRLVRAREVLPRNTNELWDALQSEWQRIDPEFIAKLYQSMPRRVEALKKAQGWHTKY